MFYLENEGALNFTGRNTGHSRGHFGLAVVPSEPGHSKNVSDSLSEIEKNYSRLL